MPAKEHVGGLRRGLDLEAQRRLVLEGVAGEAHGVALRAEVDRAGRGAVAAVAVAREGQAAAAAAVALHLGMLEEDMVHEELRRGRTASAHVIPPRTAGERDLVKRRRVKVDVKERLGKGAVAEVAQHGRVELPRHAERVADRAVAQLARVDVGVQVQVERQRQRVAHDDAVHAQR